MKKLIVLSVIFALVAGAVFAQDIGGAVYGKVNLAEGSSASGDKVRASGELARARLQVTAQNDEESFGGLARFDSRGNESYGFAWWKPMDMLRLQIGRNADGDFGADGVARWGFYQEAGDAAIIEETWRYGAAFFGGFGDGGLVVTLSPMEELAINIGVPYFNKDLAEYVYKRTNVQVAYTMEGLGKFAVTYAGGAGKIKEAPYTGGAGKLNINGFEFDLDEYIAGEIKSVAMTQAEADAMFGVSESYEPGKVFAYFELSMIENLNVHAGFAYTFNGGNGSSSYKNPIAAGLGAMYNMDAFGVKARLMSTFAGDDKNLTLLSMYCPTMQ